MSERGHSIRDGWMLALHETNVASSKIHLQPFELYSNGRERGEANKSLPSDILPRVIELNRNYNCSKHGKALTFSTLSLKPVP